MNLGLDTSIVVRLLVGTPELQQARVWELVDGEHRAGRKVLISDIVVAEVFHVLMHHYKIPADEAVAALRRVLQDVRVAGGSAKSLLSDSSWSASSTEFVDALIHRDYADDNHVFVTFDKKASRFTGSRLLR